MRLLVSRVDDLFPRMEWVVGVHEMKELLTSDSVAVPPQVLRLIEAAKTWAAFQDADSKLDQKHDIRLAAAALDAEINLRVAVEGL